MHDKYLINIQIEKDISDARAFGAEFNSPSRGSNTIINAVLTKGFGDSFSAGPKSRIDRPVATVGAVFKSFCELIQVRILPVD